MKKVYVPPSPAINRSLARTGYDYKEALREIIDNSADAIKKRLATDPEFEIGTITIYGESFKTDNRALVVGDNGIGVDASLHEETGEAREIAYVWSLGKSHKTNETDELYGVFGVGLKTSAQSLGKSTTFTSRNSPEQELMTSVYRSNAETFDIPVFPTSEVGKLEKKAAKLLLKDSPGSVVVIRDLSDKLPNRIASVYDSLADDLARIYRDDLLNKKFKFCLGFSEGRQRIIDHNSIVDPLYDTDETTTFYLGDKHGNCQEVEWQGHKFYIRASHTAVLGETKKKTSGARSRLGSGIRGSRRRGIYFRRNDREVSIKTNEGENVYWKSLANVSNFFVEVNFKDDGVGSFPIQTDFGKRSVLQDPNFVAYMTDYMDEIIRKVKKVNSVKLNKDEQQVASETAQIFSEMIKSNRKPASSPENSESSTKSNKARKKSESKRASVTRYRGRTEKFEVNTKHGVRSFFKFESVSGPGINKDLPCWLDIGEEGTYVIYINEENDWIQNMKDNNLLSFVYKVAGSLVLSCKENFDSDCKSEDFIEFFGQLLNDFTQREKSFKSLPSAQLVVNNS